MYAIIETGGKQHRVEKGDVIDIELLSANEKGCVEFKNVLFLHDGNAPKIGIPYVSGCTVIGELVGEIKGPKLVSFKYKKRKSERRTKGHRQKYSRVKITEIQA